MSRSSKAQAHHPSGSRVHGVGVLREQQHDPYKPRMKLAQGTTCPVCHAQVRAGRWQWVTPTAAPAFAATPSSPEPGSHTAPQRCPACTRIAVQDPGGELLIRGRYAIAHADELRALIRREAERETAEHAMERLMAVSAQADGSLLVTTTGVHLIRVLGHALERAHKGELVLQHLDAQAKVRATWQREG